MGLCLILQAPFKADPMHELIKELFYERIIFHVLSEPINFQKLDTAYYIYTLKNTRQKITFSVKFESYIKLEIIENHEDWYFFTVKKSYI